MFGPDKKVKYRKKKRKSLTDNVALLYKEDIGFEGVKRKRELDNIGSFELLVDEREERKRKKRMVRVHGEKLPSSQYSETQFSLSCILGKICPS